MRTKRKNPAAHAIVRSRFFISHSGPSEDTLAAYRLMGLDLDATYDEIEAAFNDLTAQYAGDAKRKMYLVLGSMGACHVLLLLLFKIYFFHYAS